jgi:hypothetical protein
VAPCRVTRVLESAHGGGLGPAEAQTRDLQRLGSWPAAVVVTLSHLPSPTPLPTTSSSVESTQLGNTTEGGLVKKKETNSTGCDRQGGLALLRRL